MLDEIIVRDDFVAPAAVRELALCAERRRRRGEFRNASIGAARLQRVEIRGDSTCWLEPPLWPAEQDLLQAFEALRLEWNRCTYLGLFELEAHYACYPPGAGYARHIDQVQGGAARLVSLVLYLNECWPSDAGGELRIFSPTGPCRDVLPLGGRLVSFVSAAREHQVLPADRTRLSVSGWFRGRR